MRLVTVLIVVAGLARSDLSAGATVADSVRTLFEGAGDSHRRYTVEHVWQRRLSIRQLERAALLAPHDATTLARLGEAYLDGSYFHWARLAFERALAVDPADAEAHFGLGRLCEREWLDAPAAERLDEALAHFEAAVCARPDFYEAWVALAAVRFERRDPWTARDAATAAHSLAPGRVEGELAAAYLAYRTGLIASADSLFAIAIPRCPAGIAERFADITPLLNEGDRETFDELKPQARIEYARRFWSRSDPDPTTPQNEAQLEFWSRLSHALLLISDPWSPHWLARTDLYARYGHSVQLQAEGGASRQTEMPQVAWGEIADDPSPEELEPLHQDVIGGGLAVFAPLPPGVRELPLASSISRFEGPRGARLAVRVETPGTPVDTILADCVVIDAGDREIARGTHALSPSGCDPAELRAGEFAFDLAPGRYRIAVAVHDALGGRGVMRAGSEIVPVSSSLAMSDVVLACGPSDAGNRQGPVFVNPNLRGRVAGRQDLYAYFEVYHLRQASDGANRFEYEYTVHDLGKGAAKQESRAARGAPRLSFRSMQEGVGPLRRQFITVPAGTLPPGRYRLTIAVRDELAGTGTQQSTEFVKATTER